MCNSARDGWGAGSGNCSPRCEVRTPEVGEWVPVLWDVMEARRATVTLIPASEREASFFADVAGRFILRATAAEGGCAHSDTVTLVSRPDADVHVQNVWSTSADLDETDADFGGGADLDLHLRHEQMSARRTKSGTAIFALEGPIGATQHVPMTTHR